MIKIELEEGKYTYLNDDGKQSALRHGEPWRDLTGDNLIYAMACRIETLEQQRDALAESVSARDANRYRYALDQIGFYFAGTDHQNISDICLRVLAGESVQDIRRNITPTTK